jgi:hypothetical protein
MAEWTTLSREEQRAFWARKGTIKRRPHAMTKKVLHWSYCAGCGLVALRNEITRQALRNPCETEED